VVAPSLLSRISALLGSCQDSHERFYALPRGALELNCCCTAPAGQYKGVVDCATQIIRQEGAAAMFR
jgi:hypothetical protein